MNSNYIMIAIVTTIFLIFTTIAIAEEQEFNILLGQTQKEQFINHIRNIPIPVSGNEFPIYANSATNSWIYTSISGWTAGYYPSLLWWVYEQTGNSADLTRATSVTNQYATLDNVDTDSHDQYIATMPYIKGLKHVNNPIWKDKAFAHINRLVNIQFNPDIGAVTITTKSKDVISDSMTAGTVPLLIWAYKNSPSESDKVNYLSKLKSHVDVVTRDHFKLDNSGAVWQSVHYNSDGTVSFKHNHQAEGSSESLTWARGQAWYMYGSSELYEFALYLNDPSLKDKYLQSYNKATNFWIGSLGKYSDSGVMKNTIGMTTGKYDTSATTIAVSSLLKMYRLTGNSNYLNVATRSFTGIMYPRYFSNGRLLHGFYAPKIIQDAELIWGDYYLSEMFDRNVQQASIIVTTPNGGETWKRGYTRTISWTKTGNPGTNVRIQLYKGSTLVKTISTSTPNDGSFNWNIPSVQAKGNDYKIKITSTSNNKYNDWSNNNFRIS